MTLEQQRIAIAEWMGWKLSAPVFTHAGKWVQYFSKNPILDKSMSSWAGEPHDVKIQVESVPDFPNDLNAMHEAEKKLSLEQREIYLRWLSRLTEKGRMANSLWLCTNANPQHRSESLCRTLWLKNFEK